MNPSSVLQLLSTIKSSAMGDALSLKGAESHIVIPVTVIHVTVTSESVTRMTLK